MNRLFTLLVLAPLCGCAWRRSDTRPAESIAELPQGPRKHVISAAETQHVSARTAYDVVLQLRPEYLAGTGLGFPADSQPIVIVDARRPERLPALADIAAATIEEIEFVIPSDAAPSFGALAIRGVFLVRLRSGAATPKNAMIIDAVELRGAAASNLYDAIVQLRPAFFATRGAISLINEPPNEIIVIVNRQVRGGVSELRQINTTQTKSVRRLTAAEVFQLTGASAPAGGILVELGPSPL
jgi:hypothetical protein